MEIFCFFYVIETNIEIFVSVLYLKLDRLGIKIGK